MAALRGSANYVWDITQVLGQGATSMVYSGRNKRTGEEVAVKVFSASSYQRPFEVQLREYDVMRKLNSQNIVKLLSVEEEQSLHQKVLIMELCRHGSLHTVLDSPENGYGVEEETFLCILKHVANGMKHLRDNGIIHRDVKPGNILRSMADDGSWVYKLTDFGAARELEDEESFMSLYGTEEYLHPDMYERAVLRRSPGKVFASTVDLWSLGVTFYHIATGNLPFRPYGGRRNRETMHLITAQKEPGVISGVQRTEGGKIEWSRTLPETCQLSQGLRNMLTPFLASLLEREQQRTGPFEKFFSEAENITRKIVVDIFCSLSGSSLKVYVDPTDTLSQLQDLIAIQTDIAAADQLLIYHGELFSQIVDPLASVSSYPRGITCHNPLFVFSKTDDSCCFTSISGCSFPNIQSSTFLDTDYSLCKKSCIVLYSLLRKVEKLSLRGQLVNQAVENFRKELDFRLIKRERHDSLSHFCQASLQWHRTFIHMHNHQVRCLHMLYKNGQLHKPVKCFLDDIQETLRTSVDSCQAASLKVFSDLSKTIDILNEVTTAPRDLRLWDEAHGCFDDDKYVERVQVLVDQAMLVFVLFKDDKAKKTLSFNEDQIHKFEKNQLTEICAKACSLVESAITKSKVQFTEYKSWFCRALKCLKSVNQLSAAVKDLSEQQTSFVEGLNSFSKRYVNLCEDGIKRLEDHTGVLYGSLTQYDNIPMQMKPTSVMMKSAVENNSRKEVLSNILDELKTSRTSLEEVMLLMHENTTLINSFKNLPESPTDMSWEQPDVT
ncbi:serine/threonine-protein kinase TBK1-like [Gigantopelta aegis]|uniref:serine/threonine-protein kinase TBK1-like n=1 Tax=Gigantopelta aegis TaxID=1735272 RepID=UPI001B88E50D|nr:serine/threonine-protein kinase TBK1-like [Gigantopelta aegis]